MWWPSKIYGLKKIVSSEFMGSVVFIGAYAGIYKCRFSTLPWKRVEVVPVNVIIIGLIE